MKEFGKDRVDHKREEFTLHYKDGDEGRKSATFGIIPSASAGEVRMIISAARTGSGDAVLGMVRLLSKQMDDRDGEVRRAWKVKALKQDEHDDRPPSYRGPDGNIYPFSDEDQLAEWGDQKLWSSRRRWDYLMNEDDNAIVEMSDLEAISEWAMGLAADRPTPPRV